MNHYEELGVSPNATQEEIHQAYRNAVKLMHPDRQTDPAVRDIAERQMIRLNAVAQILLDPEQRLQYDHALFRSRLEAQAAAWPRTEDRDPFARGSVEAPRTGMRGARQDHGRFARSSSDAPTRPLLPVRRQRRRRRFRSYKLVLPVLALIGIVCALAWTNYYDAPPYQSAATSKPPAAAPPPATATPLPLLSTASQDESLAAYQKHLDQLTAVLDKPPARVDLNPPQTAKRLTTPVPKGRDRGHTALLLNPAPVKTAPPQPVTLPPPPSAAGPSPPDALSSQMVAAATSPIPQPLQRPPLLINQVAPAYPAIAKNARVQGVVDFLATIDSNGRVRSAAYLSGPPVLKTAARNAILKWHYRPAMVGNTPIQSSIRVSVAFRLDE